MDLEQIKIRQSLTGNSLLNMNLDILEWIQIKPNSTEMQQLSETYTRMQHGALFSMPRKITEKLKAEEVRAWGILLSPEISSKKSPSPKLRKLEAIVHGFKLGMCPHYFPFCTAAFQHSPKTKRIGEGGGHTTSWHTSDSDQRPAGGHIESSSDGGTLAKSHAEIGVGNSCPKQDWYANNHIVESDLLASRRQHGGDDRSELREVRRVP